MGRRLKTDWGTIMSDKYKNGILSLVCDLLRKAEKEGLRVRIEPSKSGHTYNVGEWEEMSGKDSYDKPTQGKHKKRK
jgi:hypothetical protein